MSETFDIKAFIEKMKKEHPVSEFIKQRKDTQVSELLDVVLKDHPNLLTYNTIHADGIEGEDDLIAFETIKLSNSINLDELKDRLISIDRLFHIRLWIDTNSYVDYATTPTFAFKLQDHSKRDGWQQYIDEAIELKKMIAAEAEQFNNAFAESCESAEDDEFQIYINNLDKFIKGIDRVKGLVTIYCFDHWAWIDPYDLLSEDLQKRLIEFYIQVNN